MEKFIIPAYYHGKIFTYGDLIKPKGGILADAQKATNDMLGMVKLLSGCLASITDSDGDVISQKDTIEGIVRSMPYQTAEYLAMKVFANRSDGAIEQIVHCPRCKDRFIYEYIDEENDDRIRFDDMEVNSLEDDDEPIIHLELDDPIVIKSKKDQTVIHSIENITFRYPTMNDGISAAMKFSNDVLRRQYKMYASAITHINGEEVDVKFKNLWGMFIFNRMESDDIKKISDNLKQCGLKKTMNRTCSECDKNFDFIVDVSNFFD